MVRHTVSADDRHCQTEFETCRLPPGRFNHRAHLRLAYIYLVEHPDEVALALFRNGLLKFLSFHGVAGSKYHETLTDAWILAMRHFMERSSPASSFDDFIAQNPILLDSGIMMTHYSSERLFSAEARQHFVEPDLSPIPRHEASSA